LEIGGAYAHKFRELLEFLGLTVLIITDIDSVIGPPIAAAPPATGAVPPATGASISSTAEEAEGDEEEDEVGDADDAIDSLCEVSKPYAVTSNYMLRNWLPKMQKISDLLNASEAQRTQTRTVDAEALVYVTYQSPVEVTWKDETKVICGRTLEEAFAYENLVKSQSKEWKELRLRIRKSDTLELDALAKKLHEKIKKSGFNKTDFALALLALKPSEWVTPKYISSGLRWLEKEVTPPPQTPHDAASPLKPDPTQDVPQ
jgi:hypothetical protein